MEFGQTRAYWDTIGWRVDVKFVELRGPIRPADNMDRLAPLLPRRYSPLQPNGHGLQSVYLAFVPDPLAGVLIDLVGREAHDLIRARLDVGAPESKTAVGLLEWEEHEIHRVQADQSVGETERKAIVLARRGQGTFKDNVMRIERACRITGVDRVEHLRASHCKPWRDSTNEERLEGANGLLLTRRMPTTCSTVAPRRPA